MKTSKRNTNRKILTAVLPSRPPGHPGPWLRASRIALYPRLPAHVAGCRHHTARLLAAWNLGHLTDSAQLAVSELVTNALVHGAAPVTVTLRATSESLLISVRDAAPAPPESPANVGDDEGGRGLEIVSLLTQSWGYYYGGGGKTVWALLQGEASRHDSERPIFSGPQLSACPRRLRPETK